MVPEIGSSEVLPLLHCLVYHAQSSGWVCSLYHSVHNSGPIQPLHSLVVLPVVGLCLEAFQGLSFGTPPAHHGIQVPVSLNYPSGLLHYGGRTGSLVGSHSFCTLNLHPRTTYASSLAHRDVDCTLDGRSRDRQASCARTGGPVPAALWISWRPVVVQTAGLAESRDRMGSPAPWGSTEMQHYHCNLCSYSPRHLLFLQ